ncbi:hypothetical protein J3L18_31030 [Mucilaginibacter gossypii]|uniref:hypothetical protein n=1 Tax=Mucilaginibacter gossypii TaxID=551996 RepID=UPI000DCDCA82|nr:MULTISPECIES: hypothetical protein [Mucilaginibacter]QTE37481.1 hypothetical protein J3L18_31030 [Mucilaginibacter gossypii]RAV52308.1 hypothetical protein DIU36_24550 [Mucilaginibacter rubeus]
MGKSIALERKVTAYPDPKYHRLLMASSKIDGVSVSELVGKAIKSFFDGMPERDIEELMSKSKNL